MSDIRDSTNICSKGCVDLKFYSFLSSVFVILLDCFRLSRLITQRFNLEKKKLVKDLK